MASMSPPAGSPEPVKKRGGGARKRGGASGGADKEKSSSGGGRGGRGSRGGRGGGRGGKKGQRRESTAPREGSVSMSAAGTPFAYGTPGASTPFVGNGSTLGISPEQARTTREGSPFSGSRRSATAPARSVVGGAGGTTEGGQGLSDDEDEDDEDADNELDLLLGNDDYDEQARERSEAKEALRLLLDQFSPEQLERYEVYRRSGFQKIAIRRLINHVLQQSCSPNIVVAVRGLAKVFVGEIVESARAVQDEAGHSGPLAPDDLREAYRRYRAVADKRGSDRAKLFVR